MFRIKICGVTNVDDARAVVEAGADAIGLNFYPSSLRFVTPDTAQQIVDILHAGMVKVGVFVNAPVRQIYDLQQRLHLDAVQLHGDEPPEMLAELRGLPIIKALRPIAGLEEVALFVDRCNELDCLPRMLLIDAYQPGQYGGTGARADWSQLVDRQAQTRGLPLILAGGLTPLNVAAAIAAVHPQAVDTASGVEASAGRKSRDLCNAFVAAAQGAFEKAAQTG